MVYSTDTTISGQYAITGTESVEVTNNATVTITNSQNYTGATTVTSGRLILDSSSLVDDKGSPSNVGIIQNSSGFTIKNGGTVELKGQNPIPSTLGSVTHTIEQGGVLMLSGWNFTNIGPIILNGGTISSTQGSSGYGAFLFRDNITVNADSIISANYTIRGIWGNNNGTATPYVRTWSVAEGATLTVSGRGQFQETSGASISTLNKTGAGTILFSAAALSSNSGSIINVNEGTIRFTHASAFGSSADDALTINVNSEYDSENNLVYGKVIYEGGGGTIFNDFVVNEGTSLTFNQTSEDNGTLSIAGDISGSGTVSTVAGNKFIRLTGDNSGFEGTWEHSGSYLFFTNADSSSKDAAYKLTNTGVVFLPSVDNTVYEFGSLSGTCWDMRFSGESAGANRHITLRIGNLDEDDELNVRLRNDTGESIAIEKVGSGTLTLTNNDSTFTGGITVKNGTLKFTKAATRETTGETTTNYAGSIGTGTVTLTKTSDTVFGKVVYEGDGGTISNNFALDEGTSLEFKKANTNTSDLILSGKISGGGTVSTSVGQNYIRLTGDNSGFSGTWNHSGNYLFFTNANSSSKDAAYVLSGAVVFLPSANNTVYEFGSLSGTFGDMRLSNETAGDKGNITLRIGNLNLDDTITAQIWDKNQTDKPYTLAIEKVGTGTLTLNCRKNENGENIANTYSGGTTVKDGTVKFTHVNAIGTGAITTEETGNLAFAGDGGTLVNNISLAEGTTFAVQTNDNGTLTLTGNVSGTGQIQLTAGTLQYSGSTSTFTPSVDVAAGTTLDFLKDDLRYSGNLTGSGTVKFSRQTRLQGDNSGFAGTFDVNNTTYLTTSKSSSGNAHYNVNALFVTVATTDGQEFELGNLTGAGRIRPSTESTATNMYLKVGGNNDENSVYNGYILDYSGRKMGLIKTGTGMLTLTKDMTQNLPETGASAYSLGTKVQDGILKIASGAAIGVASGAGVQVNATSASGSDEQPGIILQGTINGELTVDGQFIIDFTDEAAWKSTGIVVGDIVFNETATLDILLPDEGFSRDMTYTLTAGNSGSDLFLTRMLELYQAGVQAGSLADIWSLGIVNGNLVLGIDSAKVPEPATWLLLLGGLCLAMRFQRRKKLA